MTPLLQSHRLTLSIGGKTVCEELQWSVAEGEIWGVLGVNGVGKSTLLRTLAGLYRPDRGEVRLQGTALSGLSRRQIARGIGLVFQHQDELFPLSVFEQVMMGRHPHSALLRGERPEDREIAWQALQQMELNGLEGRGVETLSGGERRRVAIATILAQRPRLYLLDEPEAHLDPSHQQRIFQELSAQIRQQPAAGVMALHDINLAIDRCSHLLLLLGDGRVEQGRVEEMATRTMVEQLYGTEMVEIQQGGRTAFLLR
jgi:iron complex transport system ATP-binding protein